MPYDAIVIGSGAGGGIAAAVLAESGRKVLLLERGSNLAYAQVGRDHLRNHRHSMYGHNTGPELDGHPRVFVDPQGRAVEIRPHDGRYQNNAMTVGGGTRVYGAQAWRFMPDDFRMAARYGVPAGSSLADWPISYQDMEPWYDRAEWEIGVCGEASSDSRSGPRRRGYPMPPVRDNPQRLLLREAAERLGWQTQAVPLLINSVPYGGRAACVRCSNCVGFACPSDGKNGSHNTVIPRALATGRCDLVSNAIATSIEIDGSGRVHGVEYIVDDGDAGIKRSARADLVVLSAGAIESARLLLNSRSSRHPAGLGNHSDQVGRHLQGHYYPGGQGVLPRTTFDGLGPGVSISTTRFNHGNPGVIGGGMLANDFIKLPVIYWKNLPPDLPRWGLANKQFMRSAFTRSIHITGPVQEIPSPDARVQVDPTVKDRWGVPVARLSGTTHPETVRTATVMRDRALEWIRACGAERVWSNPISLGLSGGQHQAGTCRMGEDPATSVTDPWGRVHGHDNLYVLDGSLHVTNGGFNPVLTIMALAFRGADHIVNGRG